MSDRDVVDLREFVNASILRILKGIEDARSDPDVGWGVAPQTEKADIESDYQVAWHDGALWTTVAFDVAVTVEKSKDGKASGELKIPLIPLGMFAKGKVAGRIKEVGEGATRLRFSVPLRLNRGEEDD